MNPRTSREGLGSSVRNMSHGRGGAGNIGKERRESFTNPADLVTPTLKSDLYTTGRGGSGNMAKNDPKHPELARASQDVDGPPPREYEGPHHVGRGGAANIVASGGEEKLAKEHNQRRSQELHHEASANGEPKGLVEKGKDFLGKLGAKK